MNIFFSHNNDDSGIVQELVRIMSQGEQNITAFFSSDPQTGMAAGDSIMPRINREISGCRFFVPVITESYVRSVYCMYELSVAAFLQEQGKLHIIPMVSSKAIYDRIDSILAQFDLLYLDACSDTAPQVLRQTFPWIPESMDADARRFFGNLARCTVSQRPYIGMSQETYTSVLEYCEKYGIRQLKNTTLPIDLIKTRVAGAKEVILLSTTGAALIKALCADAFPQALARGCRISVLVPNQHSQFCEDVAEIERPDGKDANMARLVNEYAAVMGYLADACRTARERLQAKPTGTICCYCSHNLLRQTILLVRNEDDSVWAWVSLTMPPKRTVDGTPSFEAAGRLEPGQLVYLLWSHCCEIRRLSERRGTWFPIESSRSAPFFLEKPHARAYWDEKYAAAKKTMDSRKGLCDSVLIEIAAQHPLKLRKKPGLEFKKRLDMAIRLYEDLSDEGYDVHFYVPGSRHRHNGKDDLVSLSKAGCDYLLEQGIPAELVLGEDMNAKYKGDYGVYNSADECYVASQIFLEGEYDRLICICSPHQVFRKTLFYMEFGVLPQCYSVPAEQMYHSALNEIFESVQNVLYKDHSWQDPDTELFQKFREERMPRT